MQKKSFAHYSLYFLSPVFAALGTFAMHTHKQWTCLQHTTPHYSSCEHGQIFLALKMMVQTRETCQIQKDQKDRLGHENFINRLTVSLHHGPGRTHRV